MVNLKQKELADWQTRNFGQANTHDLALGMAEEVGELCHFVLKRKQGIREGNGHDCKPEIADAFADTMIYGIQLMTSEGLDAEKVLEEVIAKFQTYPDVYLDYYRATSPYNLNEFR